MRARVLLVAALALIAAGSSAGATVTVGSKAFPESWVLAEALAQVIRSEGAPDVRHRIDLGGTEIVFQALLNRIGRGRGRPFSCGHC